MTSFPICLHVGDSCSMPSIDDESVALVLTSPPYFPTSHAEILYHQYKASPDMLADAEKATKDYARDLSRKVFAECFRILVPGGHMVIQTRDVRVGTDLVGIEGIHRAMAESVGFRMTARHFWRNRIIHCGRFSAQKALFKKVGVQPVMPEVFLVFHKPGPTHLGVVSEEAKKILMSDFSFADRGHLQARHEYQSPIPLLCAFIEMFTLPDDTIVDPFAGGGTTGKAALMQNRNAILYEIDPDSADLIRANLRGYLREF